MMTKMSRDVLTPFLPLDSNIYMLDNPISVTDEGRSPVESNKRALFVGRLSREKGVANLSQALRDLGMSAVFVGDGHLRAEIQAQLPDSEFTGWLNKEGVSAKMREARILAFPSTWYEVQPLTPIEAAANGVPSIVSNCTTAIECIEHNERGLHFQHDSVEALKQQLIASQDDKLVERLSRNAYSWYWNNPWTVQRHTRELIAIYEQLQSGKTSVASLPHPVT
ncbi:MAG: glycosyl transferase family 1 [Schlesneria sp.]|nr:glycosyl transferase family 1 [Schlesneria sp.]